MGLHLKKKLRKDPESDEEFENADSVESDDATVEEDEEVEEEGEDDDIDEEGEEEDVDDDDRDEEEDDDNDSLGEEEEEGEETDNENKKNKIYRDTEMNELEKEYMNLRHQEQDILQNLKRHKDEDVLKGQAVKNQKALWDKTLELRFLLQKAFSSSNRLPQSAVRSTFCNSDKGVDTAYSELICSSKKTLDSLLELQEALIEKNPSILQDSDGKSGKSSKHSEYVDDDDDWARIYQLHARIAPFRDKSIDKWQRKTQVTTGTAAIKSKLHTFNQNVSQQVAGYMRDPSRMIKQMQLRRPTVGIFGTESQTDSGAQADGKSQIDNGAQDDGDPDLIDDSELYQQLLKEFFENIDPSSSETAFYALKRLQTKKRKIVDRRASKSRKIRYHVHEKIVNFMAPQPMDLLPMAPKLFENLFGLRTQKPALE